MTREARAVSPDAGRTVVGARGLAAALDGQIAGLISFGLCGALDPKLAPGDLVIGTAVVHGETRWEADASWIERLAGVLPEATMGIVAGSETMITSPSDKARLRAATGAIVGDMESQAVALAARQAGLPFAVVRAISDAAGRELPRAAQAGFGDNGEMNVGAVLRALARRPWELPALVRIALEAGRGFRTLDRAGPLLVP